MTQPDDTPRPHEDTATPHAPRDVPPPAAGAQHPPREASAGPLPASHDVTAATETPRASRDVPPLHLEQLAHGELSPERAAIVRAQLGPDADARVAAILASDRDILTTHPPATIAAAIHHRATPPSRARKLWLAAPALACAALALLVLRPGPDQAVPEPTTGSLAPPDEVRIKGLEPRLVLHRQTGDTAAELTAPATAKPRDVLQVSYIAAGAAHGVILSLDGNALVTLHHPAGTADSTALRQDGAVRLPHAYELDDAPRFERFVFVTADAPLSVVDILTAARALAATPRAATDPLALPPGARQTSFLVEKPGR